MNERLLDLAVEANDQTGNEFDLNYKKLDAFLEKFAELIIEECISACATNRLGKTVGSEDLIKQRFGVEE